MPSSPPERSWPPVGVREDPGPLSAREVRVRPARAQEADVGFPPPGWPSKAQIDYAQAVILLGLLLLALPWVLTKLLTDPGELISGLVRGRMRI